MCSGYYSYADGYTPDFPGIARFKGCVVHPQDWTDDVDYENKRVLVIGSGVDCRYARARARKVGGPRHHAAALADVYRCVAGPG